jgi:hypothetical protein
MTANAVPKSYLGNCVYYARSVVPDLPTGLFTYEDKVSKLLSGNKNATTTPSVGSVAVIKTQFPEGHVGVVKSVTGDNVVISETNYKTGQYSERTLPKNHPSITGYWNSPNLKSTPDLTAVKNAGKTLSPVVNILSTLLSGPRAQGRTGGLTADDFTNFY